MVEETKHDLFLKRIQILIAILVGVASLILAIYNIKKTATEKPASQANFQPAPVQPPPPQPGEHIRSALDEAGAAWIKKLAKTDDSSK